MHRFDTIPPQNTHRLVNTIRIAATVIAWYTRSSGWRDESILLETAGREADADWGEGCIVNCLSLPSGRTTESITGRFPGRSKP